MNTNDRLKRVQELLPHGDRMPWSRIALSNLADADGNRILDTTKFSEMTGVSPSNDVNAEIIEQLTHIMASDPHMLVSATVANLQMRVVAIANQIFPDRTPDKAWKKLYEELGEVIKKPSDPLEWADVFILLFDLASYANIDIQTAIDQKLEILKTRKWRITETGTYQHIPDAPIPTFPPPTEQEMTAFRMGVSHAETGQPYKSNYSYGDNIQAAYKQGYDSEASRRTTEAGLYDA